MGIRKQGREVRDLERWEGRQREQTRLVGGNYVEPATVEVVVNRVHGTRLSEEGSSGQSELSSQV